MKRSTLPVLPGDAPAPPLTAILLSVSGLSRLLHRANLLECWVIPDKMTIFSSGVLGAGQPGETFSKKRKHPLCRVARCVDINISLADVREHSFPSAHPAGAWILAKYRGTKME